MNIMLFHTCYYPEIFGGAEYSVKYLAEKLMEKGNRVCVVCFGKKDITESIAGVTVYRIKSVCYYGNKNPCIKILRKIISLYNPFIKYKLNALYDEFKPDVIHVNSISLFSPLIWKLFSLKGVRVVNTIRDYIYICPRFTLVKGNSTVCNIQKTPCKIWMYIIRTYSKYVDVVTGVSNSALTQVCDKGVFPNAKRYTVYNATPYDLDKLKIIIQKKKDNLLSKKNFTFVYLGTLADHKGVKWLINSFLEINLPNIELRIAGKGYLEQFVVNATRGNDKIKYEGFLEADIIDELLVECDILIIPSVFKEPCARVVLDAYKSGLPVIATNRGGLPEIVKDGETGSIINADDNESLRRTMESYINNREILIPMYSNILKHIGKFDINKQADEFMQLYKDIIER